jgi:hypothetical protein
MSVTDDFGTGASLPGTPLVNMTPIDIMSLSVADPIAIAAKNKKLANAWEAYDGTSPAPFFIGPGGADDNIRINLNRHVVDTYTQWVFGRDIEISFPDDPGEVLKAIIDKAWAMSRRMTDLQRARMNGGVCGQGFLRSMSAKPAPKTLAPNPALMSIRVDPADYTKVLSYTIVWADQKQAVNFLGRPVGEIKDIRRKQIHTLVEVPLTDGSTKDSWTITEYESDGITADAKYKLIKTIPWDFPLPQFSTCQNLISNDAWGTADIEPDIIQIGAGIDRAASQAQMSGRLMADGLFVTKMLDKETSDAFDSRPHGASINLTAMEQSVELIEFEGKGMAALLDEVDRLIAKWHKLTGLPNEETLAQASIAPASGVSMELRLTSMVQRIEAYRRSYGDLIKEHCHRLLMLSGIPEERYMQDAIIGWGPILPEAKVASDAGAADPTAASGDAEDAADPLPGDMTPSKGDTTNKTSDTPTTTTPDKAKGK